MSEQPIQMSFDEEMVALLDAWFPAGKGVKSRPSVTEVIVDAPRGNGDSWTYTAVAVMWGLPRRVVVRTDKPGTAPYLLAAALEQRFIGVVANQAALGAFNGEPR